MSTIYSLGLNKLRGIFSWSGAIEKVGYFVTQENPVEHTGAYRGLKIERRESGECFQKAVGRRDRNQRRGNNQ